MGQALTGLPRLDRGSSTTKPIHSVPTRAYQTDQPSLYNDPVSDNALEDVKLPLLRPPALPTGKRVVDRFFLLTSVNHISALHLNLYHKKQVSVDSEIFLLHF